jgi:hypothetical protein
MQAQGLIGASFAQHLAMPLHLSKSIRILKTRIAISPSLQREGFGWQPRFLMNDL